MEPARNVLYLPAADGQPAQLKPDGAQWRTIAAATECVFSG